MELRTIVSQPFQENSYILWKRGGSSALVVDPGLEPDLILESLSEHNLGVAAILNTHGHADHIGGNALLKERFPQAPLLIGVGDAPMLLDAHLNLSAAFGFPVLSPPADRLLREGDQITFADLAFDVLEIPGHSPGHIVYVHRSTSQYMVLGGDVLFREGIGRYDFPGGDGALLLSGIRGKLFTLPDDTVVYPGHGPVTTIKHEKRANPFLTQSARHG
jgi:glyoxylase-like metal-dependent hydrolase (beta-lactamase superfamily II)